MSVRAWIYISGILVLGLALSVLPIGALGTATMGWVAWGVFTIFATLAQLYKALFKSKLHSDRGVTSYSPFLVFVFAGALLLPPHFFVLQVIIAHLVEWLKDRLTKSPSLKAWYIQPFNISTHVTAGLAAHWVYRTLADGLDHNLFFPAMVPVGLAAVTYLVVNHLLVGEALVLARGVSWRDSGCMQPEHLLSDFIMLCLGGAAARLWRVDPSLLIPVLLILVLIYRALQVPQLKKEAQTDDKTGLLNARRFAELASAEIERAKRFDRPLAVIMADLDLLRDVNNTYGHLAGDAVLAGVGRVLRATVRDYDIAGRFGGEEFAIVLPEVSVDKARLFAERLRQAVEAASFPVATSATPLKITMSIGIACYPADGLTLDALTHQADVAVYHAKLQGRNRVVCAADVPHFVKLASTAPEAATYRAAFAAVQQQEQLVVPTPLVTAAQQATPPAGVSAVRPAAATAGQPPAADAPEPKPAKAKPASYPRGKLGLFLGLVIVAGVLSALSSLLYVALPDPETLLMLVVLAALGQILQSEYLKGSTTSVTVAIAFAAGLIAGLPGAVVVSLATVLVNYFSHRLAFHVSAFNWSTHVLAGWVPVLTLSALHISPRAGNLGFLLPAMLVASLVYFAVETGLVTGAIIFSKGGNFVETWRERFQWLAPHYVVLCVMGLFLAVANAEQGTLGVIVFAAPVFMMRLAQQQYVAHTKASLKELERMNWELSQANNEVVVASAAIRSLNDELFLTLAKILDARDPYVSNHSTQVATYAAAIAKELELPAERIELTRQAGFLHDIGKIAISEQILHKPAKLTAEEYEIMKSHAAIGAELLETSQGLRHLAPFVRGHHEYWDGHGYPDGLRKEQIPLEARILGVCDAVEAMASDRPYKKAKSLDEITAELRRCSGTQFDPAIVDTFIKLLEREGPNLVVNSALSVAQRQAAHLELALLEAKLAAAREPAVV